MKRDYLVLAFYRANHSNIVGKLINLWTKVNIFQLKISKGNFCHVELVFSDGLSYSSQERDYADGSKKGVRFKRISYSHPERWEFVKFPLIKKETTVRKEAESFVGKAYDWLGIFLYQFLPLHIENHNEWYCSEITSYVLGLRPYKINPNKMYDNLLNYNHHLGSKNCILDKPF